MSTLSSAALEQMLEPSYMSGVLLVDASGKRIAAKYYRDKSFDVKQQLAFEKRLLAKISRMPVRADPDCILFEKYIVVFRTYADARLIVLAPQTENELMVMTVLCTIDDSLSSLLNNQMSARVLESQLKLIVLVIDEVLDDGLVLETEYSDVVARVSLQNAEDLASATDQSIADAFNTVKDQIFKSLRQ